MKHIFDELELGKLHLKNRLVRSATWENLASAEGRLPNELYKIYGELAKGGVGLIITGFTSVSADDNYFGGMARLSSDSLIEEHKKLSEICHKEGCPVFAQLALGEYIGEAGDALEADEMDERDIKKVVSLFVDAAIRAQKSGYDGVQIHAAHFFFLSRFISPAVNHRKDGYGGNAQNRAKILLEIIQKIKKSAPNLHVTMKINCSDFMEGGLEEEESLEICKMCEEAGLDSVEVSGNGTSVSGIRAGVNEAYFKDFALALSKKVRIPVILVGGHRSIENMEKVLNDRNGNIALLSLSRPLVREPDLPNRWKSGDLRPAKCVSCNMCYRTPAHRCVFELAGK